MCFHSWLCTLSVPLGCCHVPNCVYSSWIWDAHQLSAELNSASRISSQEWDGKKELYSSFTTKGNISYNVQQLQKCFLGWGSHLQCCCKTNPDLHNSSGIFPQLIYNLVWSYLAVIWITRLYVIIDDITRIFTRWRKEQWIGREMYFSSAPVKCALHLS